MQSIRPSKAAATAFSIKFAPQYTEFLHTLQKNGGWFCFTGEAIRFMDQMGPYVRLYDNENRLLHALAIGLFGESGLHQLESELNSLNEIEQQKALDYFVQDESWCIDLPDFPIPESAIHESNKYLAGLSESERTAVMKQGVLLWGGLFGTFFNTLSLMVHGEKLTSLVPKAIAGDHDSYLKAVQIDRHLLIHFPYFRERKQLAQNEGDKEFLERLSYRESNPTLRGKIRYPGLFMLFGCLDATQWLDDLSHAEILDLCDVAKLDRYQNRIEDLNYLTKRLGDYRRWRKSSGLSMH